MFTFNCYIFYYQSTCLLIKESVVNFWSCMFSYSYFLKIWSSYMWAFVQVISVHSQVWFEYLGNILHLKWVFIFRWDQLQVYLLIIFVFLHLNTLRLVLERICYSEFSFMYVPISEFMLSRYFIFNGFKLIFFRLITMGFFFTVIQTFNMLRIIIEIFY